jgi:flagellar biosynthesis protein FlhG
VKMTRSATVMAVASGKGGVGKTNVAVNLAVAMTRLRQRVGLIDADFGLGNVDVLLGLAPERNIGHLLAGEATLNDIVVAGPGGVQIVPASSGLQSLTALSAAQRHMLGAAFDALCRELDFVLIDTASGISDNVVETMLLAGRVMIVTSVEPAAIVDAYATVKVLISASPATEIGIVVNNARTAEEASLTFRQLDVAAHRFLGRGLHYYGFVSEDPAVRDAVLSQRPIVDHLPQSPASRCFRILAARMAGLETKPGVRGLRLAANEGRTIPVTEVTQCA